MIRHLLTLTFRNFARHKTSFLVNLTSPIGYRYCTAHQLPDLQELA